MDVDILHQAIAGVCPFNGVSIGDPADKGTWRIDFTATASEQQKAAAQEVIDSFDVSATPVPQSISDRQFFQQLAIVGIITTDQALASNAAVIPAPLLTIIDAMPADQQFAAKMLVSGATVFERSHPMTIAIGAAYGWSAAQIDDFFRAAATL